MVCSGDFYDGKRQAARYVFRYELPRTAPQLDLLVSLDRTTLAMRDSWFWLASRWLDCDEPPDLDLHPADRGCA
jgi:hypothetical protein